MLPDLWLGVIVFFWAGFLLLEGFDFGAGMLLPVVGRTPAEREEVLATFGPFWDGNEVWLLVAGGATFAAFPDWYATVFSGFYLPLALILLGLIVRAVTLEYRHHVAGDRIRAWCDRGVVFGSLLPALLFGAAFSDWVRGVHLTRAGDMSGSFWQLVTPYALLGGVATLLLCLFHGAVFLGLRTTGDLRTRANRLAARFGPAAVVVLTGWAGWSIVQRTTPGGIAVGVVAVAGAVLAVLAVLRGRDGWAFAGTAVAMFAVPVFVFSSIWPDVLPARAGSVGVGLTVTAASSSHYTLVVMTVVAVVVAPIVLVYQGWSYRVFRRRLSPPPTSPPPVPPEGGTLIGRPAGTPTAGGPLSAGGPALAGGTALAAGRLSATGPSGA